MTAPPETTHQREMSCVRCGTRFVTPLDEHGRAIRQLCNGCSAVTGPAVDKRVRTPRRES